MPVPSLDALEIHSGMIAGPRRSPPPRAPDPIPGRPLEVLERIMLEPLAHPPCYVLFSGGRDSSAVLAAATDVARRHGLAAPIPATMVFAGHAATAETEWQERTIGHLGLSDWVRFEVGEELDALGAVATDLLERHGVYWPTNAHAIVVASRNLEGGRMMTGGGGDELFSRWMWKRVPLRRVVRIRPPRRALRYLAPHGMPRVVWQRREEKRSQIQLHWLKDDALARVNDRVREASLARPATMRGATERFLGGRYLECVTGTLSAFMENEATELVEPFYDPRFIRAVVAASPRAGFDSRAAAMAAVFGDLLPADVLRRTTKAEFSGPLWSPATREFAASWQGEGVDPEMVDVDAVRREWLRDRPDIRSAIMLQSAWLAQLA